MRHSSGKAYIEFLLVASGYRAQKWDERVGQAFFNILNMEFPDIANTIRATSLDPFFMNNIPDDIAAEVERLYNEMVYKSHLPTTPVEIVEKSEYE